MLTLKTSIVERLLKSIKLSRFLTRILLSLTKRLIYLNANNKAIQAEYGFQFKTHKRYQGMEFHKTFQNFQKQIRPMVIKKTSYSSSLME